LKVSIIGCGNAFSKKSYNQSFLVQENGRNLLIDCGSQTPIALANAGIALKDIHDIYVSHGHADHIGGLEEVAFMRYDWGGRPTHWNQGKYAPRLIGNEGFLKELWEHSLKGGLQSMEGFEADLETFFEVVSVAPNTHFDWEGWTVELVQQIHVMAGNMIMHTYGLIFRQAGHKTVYFTTDSQHCSPRQMQKFYKDADVIFQDCELVGCNFQFPEGTQVYKDKNNVWHRWPQDMAELAMVMGDGYSDEKWGVYKFGSGVHANYAELAGFDSANNIHLPRDIKAKMYLSHYQDFKLLNKDAFGNDIDWDKQAALDGFAGFVSVGQTFEI
jgi:ribonuclease BN (tRNA processing enzyme)